MSNGSYSFKKHKNMIQRVVKVGAALESFVMILEIGFVTVLAVTMVAVWKGILSGNFRKSLIRRKPLLLPSLVFTITIILATTYVPYPMSTYHGTNQIQGTTPFSGTYRVYEPVVYDSAVQIRVTSGLDPNERLEIEAYFSQDGILVGSLVVNLVDSDIDAYGGATRSIVLAPGLYHISINATYFLDDVPQENHYVSFLVHQPVPSINIPELTDWRTFRFFLEFGCFFLVIAGVCIGGESDRGKQKGPDEESVNPVWSID
jgi:hypothetical protein